MGGQKAEEAGGQDICQLGRGLLIQKRNSGAVLQILSPESLSVLGDMIFRGSYLLTYPSGPQIDGRIVARRQKDHRYVQHANVQ